MAKRLLPLPPAGEALVGTRLQVYWRKSRKYFSGQVTQYIAESGQHRVEYDDGDVEVLAMEGERWRLLEQRPAPAGGHAGVAGRQQLAWHHPAQNREQR